MAKVYGYCRCSTDETKQDVKRQTNELRAAGAEDIFEEYEHGTAEHKKQQEMLFSMLAEGDTLIVTEVSRLTRSTAQLCSLIEMIQEKRIKLEILNSVTIDCRNGSIDPMTKAFLQMAGVFAEMEKNMISSRTKSGMANAKAKGKRIGRPTTNRDSIPQEFYKYYPRYAAKQLTKMELSKLTGLSRPTIDKYLKIVEA